MNTCTPLSLDGSFEGIVNAGAQASRNQTAAWIRKSLKTIVICMAIIFVTVLLLAFQVIPAILSVYVFVVLTCVIGFVSGRIYEKLYK